MFRCFQTSSCHPLGYENFQSRDATANKPWASTRDFATCRIRRALKLQTQLHVSSESICQGFRLGLHLVQYFVWASSEACDVTARMRSHF